MSDDATSGFPPQPAVGEIIRELRLRAGMTQGELAGKEFKAPYISAVERGRVKPSQRLVEWCAHQLKVPSTMFPTPGVLPSDTLPQRERYAETAYTQANAEMLIAAGDIHTAANTLRALRARLGAQSSKTLIWLCAYVAYLEGDLDAARRELAAYVNADAPDDSLAESAALHWLRGLIASVEKTYPLAVEEYAQAISASTESYTDAEIAIEARVSLADTLLRTRDMEGAYAEQAEAIALYEATTNPMRRGERIRELAAKAVAKRDYMRAYRLMKVAETVYRDVRTMKNIYALYLRHALMERPAIALTQREHDVRRALALARRLEDTPLREMASALLTLVQLELEDLTGGRQTGRDDLPDDLPDDPAGDPARTALGKVLILLARASLAYSERAEARGDVMALLERATPLLTQARSDAGADPVILRYAYAKAISLYEALGQEEAGIPVLREYGTLGDD